MVKTRLKDIADRAGVSESTVSRVLNDREGIAEETQRVVLDAARELGRSTPQHDQDLVGIAVPDFENPIFSAWVERLEAELFQRGSAAMIATRPRTVAGESDIFDRFLRLGVRGVVVVSGFHAQDRGSVDHYRRLTREGVHLALINGVREELSATFLSTDDDAAIRLAVSHLQQLGHTAIGLAVGDEHTWPVRGKVRTFEELIAAEGSSATSIAYTDFSYAGGYEAARELIGRKVTAIICGSDVMAAGAIEGARSLGRQVPQDVSVVGFDDTSWARLCNPPLTTLRQDVPQMARAAARVALGSEEPSRRPERTEFVIAPQLVARGSTAAAPGSASARTADSMDG